MQTLAPSKAEMKDPSKDLMFHQLTLSWRKIEVVKQELCYFQGYSSFDNPGPDLTARFTEYH